MPIVNYGPSVNVHDGYSLEVPLDIVLTDNAGSPVEFCMFSLEPMACTLDDYHEEHGIWFVISGKGRLELDGDEFVICTGETAYFRPYSRHRLCNNSTVVMKVMSFYWGANTAAEDSEDGRSVSNEDDISTTDTSGAGPGGSKL